MVRIVRPLVCTEHRVAIAPSLHAAKYVSARRSGLGRCWWPPVSRIMLDMAGRAKRALVTTVLMEDHESPATYVIFKS